MRRPRYGANCRGGRTRNTDLLRRAFRFASGILLPSLTVYLGCADTVGPSDEQPGGGRTTAPVRLEGTWYLAARQSDDTSANRGSWTSDSITELAVFHGDTALFYVWTGNCVPIDTCVLVRAGDTVRLTCETETREVLVGERGDTIELAGLPSGSTVEYYLPYTGLGLPSYWDTTCPSDTTVSDVPPVERLTGGWRLISSLYRTYHDDGRVTIDSIPVSDEYITFEQDAMLWYALSNQCTDRELFVLERVNDRDSITADDIPLAVAFRGDTLTLDYQVGIYEERLFLVPAEGAVPPADWPFLCPDDTLAIENLSGRWQMVRVVNSPTGAGEAVYTPGYTEVILSFTADSIAFYTRGMYCDTIPPLTVLRDGAHSAPIDSTGTMGAMAIHGDTLVVEQIPESGDTASPTTMYYLPHQGAVPLYWWESSCGS